MTHVVIFGNKVELDELWASEMRGNSLHDVMTVSSLAKFTLCVTEPRNCKPWNPSTPKARMQRCAMQIKETW